MKHLTPADYTAMPWANGRGVTTELLRQDTADGRIQFRLSLATVSEDGPFSPFPGLTRNLTVIDGPGFDLIAGHSLRADPLRPVAFSGDIVIAAANVIAPSRDFNVMARAPLQAEVQVVAEGQPPVRPGGLLYYFAVRPAQIGRIALGQHDLLFGQEGAQVCGGPVIVVRLTG